MLSNSNVCMNLRHNSNKVSRPSSSCVQSSRQPSSSLHTEACSKQPAKEKSCTVQRQAVPVVPKHNKKCSRIDKEISTKLEKSFKQNRFPSHAHAQMSEISGLYNITKGAVRTWFSTRRQKWIEKEQVIEAVSHQKYPQRSTINYHCCVHQPTRRRIMQCNSDIVLL